MNEEEHLNEICEALKKKKSQPKPQESSFMNNVTGLLFKSAGDEKNPIVPSNPMPNDMQSFFFNEIFSENYYMRFNI